MDLAPVRGTCVKTKSTGGPSSGNRRTNPGLVILEPAVAPAQVYCQAAWICSAASALRAVSTVSSNRGSVPASGLETVSIDAQDTVGCVVIQPRGHRPTCPDCSHVLAEDGVDQGALPVPVLPKIAKLNLPSALSACAYSSRYNRVMSAEPRSFHRLTLPESVRRLRRSQTHSRTSAGPRRAGGCRPCPSAACPPSPAAARRHWTPGPNPVDDIDDEVEAVDVVHHTCRTVSSWFLLLPRTHVLCPLREYVSRWIQPRVAVVIEDDGFVGGEQRVVLRIAQPVRVFECGSNRIRSTTLTTARAVPQVLAQDRRSRQDLKRRHIPGTCQHNIGLSAAIGAGPLEHPDPAGAVQPGLLSIQVRTGCLPATTTFT